MLDSKLNRTGLESCCVEAPSDHPEDSVQSFVGRETKLMPHNCKKEASVHLHVTWECGLPTQYGTLIRL